MSVETKRSLITNDVTIARRKPDVKKPEVLLQQVALDCIVMRETLHDGAYTHRMTLAQFEYMARRLWNHIEAAPHGNHGMPDRPTKRQAKAMKPGLTSGSEKIFSLMELARCENVGELRNLIRRKIAVARGGI